MPLLGQTRDQLQQWAERRGLPRFRGRQIADWLYRRGVRTFAEMVDLPAPLREQLATDERVGRSAVDQRQQAADGTTKLLLLLADDRRIETVVLPYTDRVSVCISSQVGCPVGCVFCATATMGLLRNLTAAEMVDQVLTAREHSPGGKVSHVVVMGMGEPMLNYDALLRALRLITAELEISARRITVSTAGHVPGIRRLADEALPVTLALSLHAPNDELRSELIPMGRKWGVGEVMDAVRHYTRTTGRRVTLEYLLLGGVNDTPELARELAGLLRGEIGHVNLIPWNAADSLQPVRAPGKRSVRGFREVLEQQGVTVTERMERGREIDAACGQLVVKRAQPEAVS